MTLSLVRLPVDLAALSRAAGDRGWSRGRNAAFDEGAALHHLLGETFGPAALQPFRLVVSPRARRGALYAYTTAGSEQLRDLAAATATPEVQSALSPQSLESKAMPTEWLAERRIGFDVRVRPIVRLASDMPAPDDRDGARKHGFRKGAEVDAFVVEALRFENREGMERAERSREMVYLDWLDRRLGDGAALEHGRIASFCRASVVRKGRASEGPDVVLHGTFRITEPEAFSSLLGGGVGRHKAYGFGMLLLRPPTPAPEKAR